MSDTPGWWRPRSAWVTLLAGVLGGLVLAGVVAAVLWPGDPGDPRSAGGSSGVSTPVVPSAPSPTSPTTPTGTASSGGGDQGDSGKEPSEAALVQGAAPAGQGQLPDSTPVTCPTATRTVSDAADLTAALESAVPGDSIALQDGTYEGEFTATTSGTAQDPIFLCGSTGAVLDGGDVDAGGYTFHLDGAQYWRLVGFSTEGGQKGVVADTTVGSVIQGLSVTGTGDEAIHLRDDSADNVVQGNKVSGTGLRNEKYGEGIYIGSAVSNWCTYSDCQPDRSDRNVIKGNTISDTTSESIDVKEGTTGGLIADNTFDGSSLVGADSWVDVKGNNYLIEGNSGTHSDEDGFQTHQILEGWGDFNVFSDNRADVGGSGHAIASQPPESNVVLCNNTVIDADEGLSNIDCS